MASLKVKDTISGITKKGFYEAENKSEDHKWFEFWHDGKLTRIKTKFSHGDNEIGDSLIALIARQLSLTKKQFLNFVECTLSLNEYVNILKEKKII